MSSDPILSRLGSRLARERLDRNLTQAELAASAGVSGSTVKRLEAGESVQLANLVRVLRALGFAASLDELIPEPPLRPLAALDRGDDALRRRASRRGHGAGSPAADWRWGDGR